MCVCVCSLCVQECMPGMLCCLTSSASCFRWSGVLSLSLQTCSLTPPSASSLWLVCLFFWRFPHSGCLAETRQLPCVVVVIVTECVLMAQLVVMTTQNCPPPWLPISSQLPFFCFYLTPPTNILCPVQAPPHHHDRSHVSGAGSVPPSISDKTPPGDIPPPTHFG